MKVGDVEKLLHADGWTKVRTKGSHQHCQHPLKPGTVTLAGRGWYLSASRTRLETPMNSQTYAIVIEESPTSFSATVPDLPDCFAVGRTREEVERLIQEAIEEHIAVLEADGVNVPAPRMTVATVSVR